MALKAQSGKMRVVFGSITPTATHPATATPPASQSPGLRVERVGSTGGGTGFPLAESTGFVSTMVSLGPVSPSQAVVA